MATATAPKVENPSNPTDLNLTPPDGEDISSVQEPLSCGGGADESKGASAVAEKKTEAEDGAATTDVQKKMKRAERFGISVQLSEEEKRNSRAERFGTFSAANGSDPSKQSEELKRKARAERFGTVKSISVDEEAKKKARLARFGSISQTDSTEEDKKKARAIRFSQLESDLKTTGKGNAEKTATVGKAGGGT